MALIYLIIRSVRSNGDIFRHAESLRNAAFAATTALSTSAYQ